MKIRDCFINVFQGDEGARVLEELALFAFADNAEFCEDPRKDVYLQGRRSVVLHIRQILKGDENGEKESD